MRRLLLARTLVLATALLGAATAFAQDAAAKAPDPHDYPTSERVLYVEACMRDHPGPHYEMLNKCACALDYIRAKVNFDDYDTLITIANAATIGGERGSEFRDSPEMQAKVREFRKLQGDAQKNCMIPPPPQR
jgi:hypothetical protein